MAETMTAIERGRAAERIIKAMRDLTHGADPFSMEARDQIRSLHRRLIDLGYNLDGELRDNAPSGSVPLSMFPDGFNAMVNPSDPVRGPALPALPGLGEHTAGVTFGRGADFAPIISAPSRLPRTQPSEKVPVYSAAAEPAVTAPAAPAPAPGRFSIDPRYDRAAKALAWAERNGNASVAAEARRVLADIAPAPVTGPPGQTNPLLRRAHEDYEFARATGDEAGMAAAMATVNDMLAGSPAAATATPDMPTPAIPTAPGPSVPRPAEDIRPVMPFQPQDIMPDYDLDPLGTGMAGIDTTTPVVEDYTKLTDTGTPRGTGYTIVQPDDLTSPALTAQVYQTPDADPEETVVEDTPYARPAGSGGRRREPPAQGPLSPDDEGYERPAGSGGRVEARPDALPYSPESLENLPAGSGGRRDTRDVVAGEDTEDDTENPMAEVPDTPAAPVEASPRPTPRPSGAVPVDTTAALVEQAQSIAAKAPSAGRTRIQWDDEGNVVVHDPRLGKNRPEMRRPHVEVFLDHRTPAPVAPARTVVPTPQVAQAATNVGLQGDRNVFKLFGPGGLFGRK